MRDQIYPMVRQMILTGVIKPGEIIDEKAIAAELHVSRTPVREAVKKLSDENLVQVVAQSATRAAPIDLREINEAFLIRRALETESAAQAAATITDEGVHQLEDNLVLHARAIERRQFVQAIEIDDQFHRLIAQSSGLNRLWRTIDISKAQLDRCRHLMVPRAGQADATLVQHRAVVDALRARDAERAREAMKHHLEAAYASTVEVLRGSGAVS
jgi:DNA-binding GntR family transcriptional regulator